MKKLLLASAALATACATPSSLQKPKLGDSIQRGEESIYFTLKTVQQACRVGARGVTAALQCFSREDKPIPVVNNAFFFECSKIGESEGMNVESKRRAMRHVMAECIENNGSGAFPLIIHNEAQPEGLIPPEELL